MHDINIRKESNNTLFMRFTTPDSFFEYNLSGYGESFDIASSQLLSIFGNVKKCFVGIKIVVKDSFQFSDEIKNSVTEYVDSLLFYDSNNKQANRLKHFFNEICNGIYCCIIYNQRPISELECYMSLIKVLKLNGIKIDNKITRNQIKFYKKYIKVSTERPRSGSYSKSERKCRFCNRTTTTGATFSNKSHAISEALGNKVYISNEECDQCNEKFSRTIEKDIIEMFNLDRIVYKIKGKKNNIPVINLNGITLESVDNNNCLIKLSSRKQIDLRKPIQYGSFIPQNVYKALYKFAISVVNNQHLALLNKNIEWLMSDDYISVLPDIKVLITKNENTNVKLNLYKIKSKNIYIGHLMFCDFEIVYLIPIVKDYQIKYDLNNYLADYLRNTDNIKRIHKQNISECRTVIGTFSIKK